MPGTLISLNVNEGDVVFEGQEIAVVEAMKMQNQLLAPRAGKIKKIYVKVRLVSVCDFRGKLMARRCCIGWRDAG
jgi:acetyl/propionyl-CoA carboxylase alpha subunit